MEASVRGTAGSTAAFRSAGKSNDHNDDKGDAAGFPEDVDDEDVDVGTVFLASRKTLLSAIARSGKFGIKPSTSLSSGCCFSSCLSVDCSGSGTLSL